MAKVFLSLGSNLGDCKQFIGQAADLLLEKMEISAKSKIYQTEPWGKTDQPDFLNQCIAAKTDLSAPKLLEFIKNVESRCGQKAVQTWGPREIDIDILFYDQQIIEQPDLIIPHPHLRQRAFVLVPLAEIAPDLVHPKLNMPVSRLAKKVDKSGVNLYVT